MSIKAAPKTDGQEQEQQTGAGSSQQEVPPPSCKKRLMRASWHLFTQCVG